ncbi:MAG: hypothetical protein MZW92_15715 [Comamonadaceae bacterium]|nr:hypothetical protein [Comamonadaceae bacterium]
MRQAPGHTLALALSLPDPLFFLIAEGALRLTTTEFSTDRLVGAHLFVQSSLGQLQATILNEFGALPNAAQSPSFPDHHDYLLPDPEILEALAATFADQPSPSQQNIDRALERWLPHPALHSSPMTWANISPAPRQKAPRAGTPTPALEELITHSVFSDGIPLFPEHYLFAYLHPETTSFYLPEPLSLGESFFEHATLTGATGSRRKSRGWPPPAPSSSAPTVANFRYGFPSIRPS